jgi:hypothetical protein
MIRQHPRGFATDDQAWPESYQAQHALKREHDVSEMTSAELERAKRQLEASLALARPGSMTSVPITAQISAIDTELADRAKGRGHGQVAGVTS